jgi:hypothetical protein
MPFQSLEREINRQTLIIDTCVRTPLYWVSSGAPPRATLPISGTRRKSSSSTLPSIRQDTRHP